MARVRTWLVGLAVLAAALVGLFVVAPHRVVAAVARWRYAEPLAVTEQFLLAAEQSDTVTLRRLAVDAAAVQQLFRLLDHAPALRAALPERQVRWAGVLADRTDTEVEAVLPSRVKEPYCYLPDDTDHVSFTLVRRRDGWRVRYVGLEHC